MRVCFPKLLFNSQQESTSLSPGMTHLHAHAILIAIAAAAATTSIKTPKPKSDRRCY
jgi:ADP-ribosylglycohydrolase